MYSRAAAKKTPEWTWREVGFSVQLSFPTRGVREIAAASFRLQSLSEGGALILTGGIKSIPDFFYLQLDSDRYETTGCYVVERTLETIHCQFLRKLTTSELDRIVAEQEMISVLDKLGKDREERKEQMVEELLRIL